MVSIISVNYLKTKKLKTFKEFAKNLDKCGLLMLMNNQLGERNRDLARDHKKR